MNKSLSAFFKSDHFSQDFKKTDGIIALLVLILIWIGLFFSLKSIKPDDYYHGRMIVFCLWTLCVLFIVIGSKKQGSSSVGLIFTDRVPYIVLGSLTVVLVAASVVTEKDYTIRWAFSLISVGIFEELIFRGYAHYRIYKLFSNQLIAIIIVGVIWGLLHNVPNVVWNDAPLLQLFIYPGGYILPHALFLWLYSRTGNILHNIVLHTLMNFSGQIPIMIFIAIIYLWCILKRRTTGLAKE